MKCRGDNHGVVSGEAVSLGKLESGFVGLDRERMDSQQVPQCIQQGVRVGLGTDGPMSGEGVESVRKIRDEIRGRVVELLQKEDLAQNAAFS